MRVRNATSCGYNRDYFPQIALIYISRAAFRRRRKQDGVCLAWKTHLSLYVTLCTCPECVECVFWLNLYCHANEGGKEWW